ncbi:unnamed protein product [Acanthoscelides obtectus]|uniref:Uncharacterized protein n=1 Tax=Acanthoscelides obtectus TaxID=200917 RepID=A0A9P0LCM9_ACAOB|nr:unnamed protein product [Acanthoscelides obtectus]CAK1620844.1 hypothetical protein AOBTE_LOCUS611 [Acanthoscelides obtectus]
MKDVKSSSDSEAHRGIQNHNKYKILLLSDDFGRNIVYILRKMLPLQNFAVEMILSPNALISDVIKNVDVLTADFNEMDYVIILAGSNDALSKGFIKANELKDKLEAVTSY